jgi:hypothetical protein
MIALPVPMLIAVNAPASTTTKTFVETGNKLSWAIVTTELEIVTDPEVTAMV